MTALAETDLDNQELKLLFRYFNLGVIAMRLTGNIPECDRELLLVIIAKVTVALKENGK